MERIAIWVLIAAGLVFLAIGLAFDEGLRSPLWWLELVLYAMMILGFARGGARLRLRLWPAALVFVSASWACGMAYELTLTVYGTGFGGMHPDTRASFILAQGDYILIALATLMLVRLWHLDFSGAFWLAMGKSLTEGLIFTGVLAATITSGALGTAALALGYYTLAYASFVALPLLLVAPESLWRPSAAPRKRPPVWALVMTGFAVAFVIRIIWGLGWGPLATSVFALPPNPVP